MGSLVLVHQKERLVGILTLLEVLECFVGNDFGGIAYMVDRAIGRLHRWVVIGSLTDQHVIVIESDRRALKMPFPNDCGFIAGRL